MRRFLILVSMLVPSFVASKSTFADTPVTSNDFALTLTRGSRLMVAAKINGRPVDALLDSAAEVTILDQCIGRQYWSRFAPELPDYDGLRNTRRLVGA
jgi:hypothetical protein